MFFLWHNVFQQLTLIFKDMHNTYILKRLFWLIPTLFGILLLNFTVMQIAPGGPVQQMISRLKGDSSAIDNKFGGEESLSAMGPKDQASGFDGIDEEQLNEIKKHFGFDQPAYHRFFKMIKEYLTFNLGTSYFKGASVSSLIASKLPASLSLSFWTLFFVYLISIPLGIAKATRHKSRFDTITSIFVIVSYALPSFLFALLLITCFSGGGLIDLFPLRGLTSINFHSLSLFGKIKDYAWHLTLPLTAMVIGIFAKITTLTKNAFLEESAKQYVLTAKAKGASERQVRLFHILRNVAVVLVASAPPLLTAILFTSSLLIEVLFSIDGLGLLSFEAAMSRDYPVMFGCLYTFTLLSMLLHLFGDVLLMAIDKRINFAK